jgi:hypothetical protein
VVKSGRRLSSERFVARWRQSASLRELRKTKLELPQHIHR